MDSPIIVALDGMTYDDTIKMAEILDGWVWGFKLEDILWDGPAIVDELESTLTDTKLIFDAKLHHTPHQMDNICRHLERLPVEYVTVHATAGAESIEAAAKWFPTKLCASLVLTSIDETASMQIYGYDHVQVSMRLAALAVNAGCTAIVCSSHEMDRMPRDGLFQSKVKKIVAGIRPEWYGKKGDLKRSCTPKRAIELGADFIVMGRPITESPDPVAAVQRTLKEIEQG